MTPRMWFDVAMLVLVLIAGAGLVWGYKEFQAMQAKIATMESTATVTSEATDALATATDTTQTVRVVVEQKRAQSEQSFQELKQNDQNARTWADQPITDSVRQLDGGVTHVFTHFALHLTVFAATAAKPDLRYRWVSIDQLGTVALPTVMRKVVEHALAKIV